MAGFRSPRSFFASCSRAEARSVRAVAEADRLLTFLHGRRRAVPALERLLQVFATPARTFQPRSSENELFRNGWAFPVLGQSLIGDLNDVMI